MREIALKYPFCALIFTFFLIFIFSCKPKDSLPIESPDDPLLVELCRVQEMDYGRSFTCPGTLVNLNPRVIAAGIPGTLQELRIIPGQDLSAGQILGRIDSRALHFQRDVLAKRLAELRLNLEQSRFEAYSEIDDAERKLLQIDRLNIQLERAKRSSIRAETAFKTQSSLYEAGGISEAQLKEYSDALLTAQDAEKELQSKIESLEVGLRPADFEKRGAQPPRDGEECRSLYLDIIRDHAFSRIRLVEMKIEETELQIRRVDEQIRKAVLKAPSFGSVTAVRAVEGEYLSEGDPVCSFINPLDMYVQTEIPESAVGLVKKGSPVSLSPGNSDEKLQGEVFQIFPEIDPRSKSQSLLCSLQDPPPSLHPGMYIEVLIHSRSPESYLALPTESLIQNPDNLHNEIFSIESGRAFRQEIRISERSGGYVLFHHSSLQAGDRVVLRPPLALEDGMRVALYTNPELQEEHNVQ